MMEIKEGELLHPGDPRGRGPEFYRIELSRLNCRCTLQEPFIEGEKENYDQLFLEHQGGE